MFQNGTNCTKDLHISNKSRTFAYGFHILNWIYGELDTPRSDCAGCFVVYLAKKIVHFTKNQLFFEKKVEKICTCQKNVVPLHRKTKNNYNNEKEKHF